MRESHSRHENWVVIARDFMKNGASAEACANLLVESMKLDRHYAYQIVVEAATILKPDVLADAPSEEWQWAYANRAFPDGHKKLAQAKRYKKVREVVLFCVAIAVAIFLLSLWWVPWLHRVTH